MHTHHAATTAYDASGIGYGSNPAADDAYGYGGGSSPYGAGPPERRSGKAVLLAAALAAVVALPVGVGTTLLLRSGSSAASLAATPAAVIDSTTSTKAPASTVAPARAGTAADAPDGDDVSSDDLTDAEGPVASPVPVPVPVPQPQPTPQPQPQPQPAPQTPQPQPSPQPPTGATPTFTSFFTPDSIDCHNGMFQMFTMSWQTTNAVKVSVAIDGPGLYGTYGPNAEISLPFNCSSSHTFLVTATGAGGHTATKSITLQPRNVQSDEPADDTDEL